jgi:hypothetical protein
MKLRALILPVLVLALMLPGLTVADGSVGSPKYFATYFMSNIRCPSCLTIERLSSETVRVEFSEEVEIGMLQWRTVNIDEEGNYHFVKDYGLYTKSVIISEEIDGKEIRWKNLPKVWEYIGSEDKFKKYLRDEITAFMAAE